MHKMKNGESRFKSSAIKEVETTSWTTIVSEQDGLFVADKEGTLYALRHDSKFTRFSFNDVLFVCQHSEPIKEEVFSQTPTKCERFQSKRVKYETVGETEPNSVALCIEYRDDSITDFYFEVLLPTTNTSLLELITIAKKEINVFLSLLN